MAESIFPQLVIIGAKRNSARLYIEVEVRKEGTIPTSERIPDSCLNHFFATPIARNEVALTAKSRLTQAFLLIMVPVEATWARAFCHVFGIRVRFRFNVT